MTQDKITVQMTNDFKGTVIGPHGTIPVGGDKERMAPYHMLFGALATCYYATFVAVARKQKADFVDATVEVTGEKRDEIPATLKWVKITMTVRGADPKNHKKLLKASELGAKYCSIHETISKVADIKIEVIFED